MTNFDAEEQNNGCRRLKSRNLFAKKKDGVAEKYFKQIDADRVRRSVCEGVKSADLTPIIINNYWVARFRDTELLKPGKLLSTLNSQPSTFNSQLSALNSNPLSLCFSTLRLRHKGFGAQVVYRLWSGVIPWSVDRGLLTMLEQAFSVYLNPWT